MPDKARLYIQLKNEMVEGVGFEPTYAMRADLQSAAFNHSAIPPLLEMARQCLARRSKRFWKGKSMTSCKK